MSRFRKKYRALSNAEQGLVDRIKDKAEALEKEFDHIPASRESALAFTKLEEAVMWAVKGVTG